MYIIYYIIYIFHKAVGTVLGLGAKKFFFDITLTYKKDTILFISISVISTIHRAISLFYPYLYTLIYVSLFLNSSFFWLAKYWGGNCPPPCSYGHVPCQKTISYVLYTILTG